MNQRTITYILTRQKSNRDFDILVDICHKSKNLYNVVNYIVRQAFVGKHENIPEYEDLIHNGKFISEYDLSKRMSQLNQPDYRALKSKISQQVIGQVFNNYKSFFKSLKSFKKDKSKFNGRPKLPKYKEKDGLNMVCFTNQAISFDKHTNQLKFDRNTKIESIVYPFQDIKNFQQVRIIPKCNCFQVEVIYNKTDGEYTTKAKEVNKYKNNAAIDIGVDNLATITSDDNGSVPCIINGRALKSINQYYNKKLASIKSKYNSQGIKSGMKSKKLTMKRNLMIKDYLHKASRRITDWCILNNIKCLYIGHNNGWKNECNMSKTSNQNFVQIPFNTMIKMIEYKCKEVGIEVKLIQEAYTSKCSSLDYEPICKHDKYCGKRIKRGLFQSTKGLINADINGSLNILRLGINKNFKIENKFNPIRIKNINELNDVCYFKYSEPVDIGQVFCPDGLYNKNHLLYNSIKE